MAAGGACRICRQNQVRSPCCRGGFPRRSRRFRRRTDGVDLIGALLLEVLVRLRCARIAAHTGLLARRWRGLWTRLPELTFHNTAPDPLAAALSQASRPALSLLDIHVSNHHGFSPARPHSLLHTAARLAPAKLVVRIWSELPANNAGATELPCFDRTTSIRLDVMGARITLPPAGDFPALESLSLVHGRLDLGNLLSRCSRLRYLKISNLWIDSITIHLPLLDDLFLHANQQLRRVDILAPVLKNMLFDADRGIYDEFSLSFSAALVKDFSWRCHCRSSNDEIWHLWSLTLHTTDIGHLWFRFLADDWENTPLQLQPCSRVLLLHIGTNMHIVDKGHVYGAMVLHLLGVCTSVQKVKLKLFEVGEESCSVNCPCDQPNNWRSQTVPLSDLKEVEIKGFKGEDHKFDLLKVIFRSAAMLERLTVKLSHKVLPSDSGYMGIHNILKAHPSVTCNIYRASGEQVL